jgi:hypothetical protein
MARRAEAGMSPSAKPAYEPDNASAWIGGGALAGLLGLAALAVAIVLGLFVAFRSQEVRPRTTALERTPIVRQGPRLEARPQQDRAALEAAAQARIETYGWADRGKGLARIPIERAMALQAGKGWPDAPAAKP